MFVPACGFPLKIVGLVPASAYDLHARRIDNDAPTACRHQIRRACRDGRPLSREPHDRGLFNFLIKQTKCPPAASHRPPVVQAPTSVRQLWYPQRSVRGYPFERFLFGGKSPEQTHVTVWSGYPHSPHSAFSYCCKHRNMRAARTFNTSRRPTASLSATVHAQVLGQRAACPQVWVGNFHYGGR
jgi:hypothetical protein